MTGISDHSPVAAVVMAGGEGVRLGGVQKGLLRVGGQTLAAWMIAALSPDVEALVLSVAHGASIRYRDLGVNLIEDPAGPRAGPVAALRSACAWVATLDAAPDLLLTIAVDTPDWSGSFLKHARALLAAGRDAVVAIRDGQPDPTCALYRVGALSHVLGTSGSKSPRAVQAALDAVHLDAETANSATGSSINTIADLLDAQRRAGVRRPD